MERTGGKCSITVHLKQTEQVSGGGVLLEACRVGRVNESDGSMILNWDLGELTSLRPSVSTEHVTGILSEMIYGGTKYVEGETGIVSMQDVEVYDALTSEDGTCTFSGLEEGAWLIHAVDSSSYGIIEDTLVAVPCYVQEGTKWTGPVYDPDIWIKGEITKAVVVESETEVRQTEKQEPETTAPQTEKRVPQTEKPSPQAPAKDTGKGTPATKAPSTEKTETVTVIDLRKRFGYEDSGNNGHECIIICDGEKSLGLHCDNIINFVEKAPDEIQPPPDVNEQVNARFISGTFLVEGEPCYVLTPELIVRPDDEEKLANLSE